MKTERSIEEKRELEYLLAVGLIEELVSSGEISYITAERSIDELRRIYGRIN